MNRDGDGAEQRNKAVCRWVSQSFWVLLAEISRADAREQTPFWEESQCGRQRAERRDRLGDEHG